MPEPASEREFDDQALEFLMDDDPGFSRSDLQSADELSRIVENSGGRELKDGEADPAGQVVLELQFGEEGAKRLLIGRCSGPITARHLSRVFEEAGIAPRPAKRWA